MSLDERIDYAPPNYQAQAVQRMDQAWRAAQAKAGDAVITAAGAAAYPFNDPWGALKEVGEFAEQTARDAWKEVRDVYGAAATWWNEITRMDHTPCEDGWNVVLETALPAAGEALYLLLVPSPSEVLENYLQPYPSKKGRRGAKGDRPKGRKTSPSGRTRKSWSVIPDVDAWAAAIIPGAQIMKGRKAGAPTRWAFDAIDRLDRVLWWFLVIDVTKTFFQAWSSGMREARFCSKQWNFINVFSATLEKPRGAHVDYSEFTINEQVRRNIDRSLFRTRFKNGTQAVSATGSIVFTVTYTMNPNNPITDPSWTARLRIRQTAVPAKADIYSEAVQWVGKSIVRLTVGAYFTNASDIIVSYQGAELGTGLILKTETSSTVFANPPT